MITDEQNKSGVIFNNQKECKKRNKRGPKYDKNRIESVTFTSPTQTGDIIRSLGYLEGVPRVGKSCIDYVWNIVQNQEKTHSDIKNIIIIAAKIANEAKKKTIKTENIKSAEKVFKSLMKKK